MKKVSNRLRLRTQLLLATVAILSALTAASLLVVRQSVKQDVQRQTVEALAASARAFQAVEQQQGGELARTAALLSALPTLKALMTTRDMATIQDASDEFWRLTGSDVLVLADNSGRAMAVHANVPGFTFRSGQQLLMSRERFETAGWWLDHGVLLRVVARPIVAGEGPENMVLGLLMLGTRINTALSQIGSVSAGQIALASGGTIVASTLRDDSRAELAKWLASGDAGDKIQPRGVTLAGRHFELGAIDLDTGPTTPLRCYLLLPLDTADAFLEHLNRTILILGLTAALFGSAFVTLISRAIIRPLDKLVTAVRALGAGDSSYSIRPHGSMEVAALSESFLSMRSELAESQRKQIEAERLAALGRAAASISHDLRHHLAAVMANASFLHDAANLGFDPEEIYGDIQRASARMTGLIDSLLEVGSDRKTVFLVEGDLEEIVRQSAMAVRSLPQHRERDIEIVAVGSTWGLFDTRRLERAFFNLLLNACEAAAEGRVGVRISEENGLYQCRVWDTGSGIPQIIRATLFEPFVSAGKNNGTGLGLAIVNKTILDHDGSICVERTSAAGTTFLIRIPRAEVRGQTPMAEVAA